MLIEVPGDGRSERLTTRSKPPAKLILATGRWFGVANWGRFFVVFQAILCGLAVAVHLRLLDGADFGLLLEFEMEGDSATQAIASRSLELLVLAALVQLGAFAILVPAVLSRVSSSVLRRLIRCSGAPLSWLLLALSLLAAVVAANFLTESYVPIAATLMSVSALFAAGNAVAALVTAAYPAQLLTVTLNSFSSDIRRLRGPFSLLTMAAARQDRHGERGTPELTSAMSEQLDHYKKSRAHEVASEGVRAFHYAAAQALKGGEFDTLNESSACAVRVLREYLVPTRLASFWSDDPLIEFAMDGTFELAKRAAEVPVQGARRDALEQVKALGLTLLEVGSQSLEEPVTESGVPRNPSGNYHLGRWFKRLAGLAADLMTSSHSRGGAYGLVKCATEVTRSSIDRPAMYTAFRDFPSWAREFIGLDDSRGRLPSAFAVYILLVDLAELWRSLFRLPWPEVSLVDHSALGRVVTEGVSRVIREPVDGLDVSPLSVVEEVLGRHSGLWGVIAQLEELSEAAGARTSRSALLFAEFVSLAKFCLTERRRLNYGYDRTVIGGVLAGTVTLAPRVWSEEWRSRDESTSSWSYLPRRSAVESDVEAALWSYTIDVLQLVRDGVVWGREVLPGVIVSSGVFLAIDQSHLTDAEGWKVPAALWELAMEIAEAGSTPPIKKEPWLAETWTALAYFALWSVRFAQQSDWAKQMLQFVDVWRLAHDLEWDQVFDPTGLLNEAKRVLVVQMGTVTTEGWQSDRVERLRARLFSDEVRRLGRSLFESLRG